MEDKIMKTIKNIIQIAVILALGACNTTSITSTFDDVYYNPKTDKVAKTPVYSQSGSNTSGNAEYNSNSNQEGDINQQNNIPSSANNDYNNSNQTVTERSTDADGNTYITNNYYNDDYYDYSYAAKMRRFYEPGIGLSYYDDYYTNMYWYSYNPIDWGISIYLGYHWLSPSLYFGYNPWWHYSYGYYYNPWYAYYPLYYHYGGGYGHGYWDGYYDGLYSNYYYNSYDENSHHHYGPMLSRTTTGSDSRPVRSFAQKYEESNIGNKAIESRSFNNEKEANRIKTANVGTTISNKANTTSRGNINPSTKNVNTIEGNAARNKTVIISDAKVNVSKNTPINGKAESKQKGFRNVVSDKSKINTGYDKVNPNISRKVNSGNTVPVNTDKRNPQSAIPPDKIGQRSTHPVNRSDNNTIIPNQRPKDNNVKLNQGDVKPKKYTNPDYNQPRSNDNFNTKPNHYSEPTRREAPINNRSMNNNSYNNNGSRPMRSNGGGDNNNSGSRPNSSSGQNRGGRSGR